MDNRFDATFEVNGQVVDKAQRFKWVVLGEMPPTDIIGKNYLCVDYDYQREPGLGKIRTMSNEWDWNLAGAITVNLRPDGRYFVVDGQHRYLAAQRNGLITDLRCIVLNLETVEEEARVFRKLNELSRHVSAIEKHRADLRGGDPTAKYIEDVVTGVGCRFAKKAKGPTSIGCVSLCRDLAIRDKSGWRQAMELACRACLKDSCHVNNVLLRALFYVHVKASLLDDTRFCDRVMYLGGQKLTMAIDHYVSATGKRNQEAHFAIALLDEVNKGLRNRFVLEKPETGGQPE